MACHREAAQCADEGLYRPACVMLGAALEGVLLATVIAKEPVLRETGRWPRQRKPPLDWTLSGLVDIAFDAGWIPSSFRGQQLTLEDGDLGNAVEWLAWLRNLVHPGAFVRELAPEVEISDAAFANGFGVIEEVFNRLAEVLNDGMPEESGGAPRLLVETRA